MPAGVTGGGGTGGGTGGGGATFEGRALLADKCSSCPSPLPYCGGQYDPNLCAPANALDDNGDDTGQYGRVHSLGMAVSATVTGWPAG